MKQIVKLRENAYIHIDSYSKTHETRPMQIVCLSLFTIITAITFGALVGADITHFNRQSVPTEFHRP